MKVYKKEEVDEIFSSWLNDLEQLDVVEAIPKDQYEAKLKSDLVAMLEEIKDEIASNYLIDVDTGKIISGTLPNFKAQKLLDSINNEIDKLKGNKNETHD